MPGDTVFDMATSHIRYGQGVTAEVGPELADRGLKRVMVVTDPNVAKLPPVETVRASLEAEGLQYALFDRVHIEPTDRSFNEAIDFAADGGFDSFVGVGGGSSIDTAKAAALYSTYPPGDFLDYINLPVGKGMPPPGPLPPLLAIPTTAGTGSEVTGVSVVGLEELHIKTGVSHWLLKPSLGLLDPDNTRTLPPPVVVSAGLDVLCHAAESYTTIEYTQRPKPARPSERPPYQGANPISDMWSLEALRLMAENIHRVLKDPGDDAARGKMLLAAAYAGLGFGNAGCHWAHATSYPVGGMLHEKGTQGWTDTYPLVPHGITVILTAPAVFRFTGPGCPQRHLTAAGTLGADVSAARPEDAGDILADRIIELMHQLNVPNGLSALGFTADDIPELVAGTLAQERLTKLSPRQATKEDVTRMFEEAMKYW